jgi:hypothetical protein
MTLYRAVGTCIWSLSECRNKIPFEECNAKLERGDSLKPRVISDGLNESCSDSAVRIGTFATFKDVIPKAYRRNSCISPDRKTHSHSNRIL